MSKPSGRTNAQSTQQTRLALLDATVACLAELGYAGTATPEIARRAGVSRGALVHHFPTKADLVAATATHLFARGTEEFRERFETLSPQERTFDAAVDLLAALFDGDTFRAGLTLIVAGASDHQLAEVVNAAVERFHQDVARVFVELFPGAATQPFGATGVVFAFAVVLGAAVYRQVGLTAYADESIGVLRILAQVAMPGLVSFPAPAPDGASAPADVP